MRATSPNTRLEAMSEPPKLQFFRVVTVSGGLSRAAVTLAWSEEQNIDAEAEGKDSSAALFRALDTALGLHGEVKGLRVHAFEDCGQENTARVRVDFGKRECAGRGASADLLEALARSYLSAAISYLTSQSSPDREKFEPPRGGSVTPLRQVRQPEERGREGK